MTRLTPLLLLVAACTRDAAVPPRGLAAEARAALAERERRLTSFRLEVETKQGEDVARHEVAFRSPNRSRGRMTAPQALELAFDGQTLVRLSAADSTYEVIDVALPPAERAFFLASTFMPFVPEGYRSPLLPAKVEAREVTHPKGPRAVELTVTPEPDVEVTYVLRMPSADFLEKRTRAAESHKVLRVTTEQCDETLKLCVPTGLEETVDGQPLGTTRVTRVELNAPLPQDVFTPRAPEGWSVRRQKLQP
jgi:hypothetical protein